MTDIFESELTYIFKKINNGFICTYTNVINGKTQTEFFTDFVQFTQKKMEHDLNLMSHS